MKSYNFKFISILLYLIFLFGVTFVGCPEVFAAGVDFVAGEYVSSDGKHTIDIASDNTALYDDTYSLKVNDKTSGDTITGKIGTDNKSVTFYQLNDSKIANVAVISYTHAGVTSYLYDYTVFSLDKTPVVDDAGSIEVWHAGVKVNAFSDFQSAVDAAMDGDTIKITSNLNVSSGAYVKGKNLIIEGNNNTLSYTTWLNSIFVVEEGASLTINNLTIDGGASGFEVDKSSINIQTGTSTTIPIKYLKGQFSCPL